MAFPRPSIEGGKAQPLLPSTARISPSSAPDSAAARLGVAKENSCRHERRRPAPTPPSGDAAPSPGGVECRVSCDGLSVKCRCLGGAGAGHGSGTSVGSPRCRKMRWITEPVRSGPRDAAAHRSADTSTRRLRTCVASAWPTKGASGSEAGHTSGAEPGAPAREFVRGPGTKSPDQDWLRGRATSGTCSCGAGRPEIDRATPAYDRATDVNKARTCAAIASVPLSVLPKTTRT